MYIRGRIGIVRDSGEEEDVDLDFRSDDVTLTTEGGEDALLILAVRDAVSNVDLSRGIDVDAIVRAVLNVLKIQQ